MKFFDRFKRKAKKIQEQNVFQQDLSIPEQSGVVFIMHLLMKEPCEMPEKEYMTSIMKKHLGQVECFTHDKDVAGFIIPKYTVEFKEGSMPPQLMVTACTDRKKHKVDPMTVSQMWDCQEDRERILKECSYHVVATDMLASGMDYKDRAEMLMDYLEALVEMYPQCEAVLFQTSGKMFTAEQIREHMIPEEDRFIYFAVNVRFFNVSGTEDMLIDTLGMSTLNLPDLQYHFHDMEPNWVVNHAYNLLSYIYENNSPIESGETVDGVTDGHMDENVQWKCHYEESLIQPGREVLDICMNEYASGDREY